MPMIYQNMTTSIYCTINSNGKFIVIIEDEKQNTQGMFVSVNQPQIWIGKDAASRMENEGNTLSLDAPQTD